jgi:hypothetical protein
MGAAATIRSASAVHSPAAAMHAPAAAVSAPAAMHAASTTAPHLSDKAVVHVGCGARRGEDLEGFSLG